MGVLDELVSAARQRARQLDPQLPAGDAQRPSFATALRGKQALAVIAEFKRSSPSQGELAAARAVAPQVSAYRDAGAAALSVLTENSRFGGQYSDLTEAVTVTGLPALMKDFVVSVAQVAEAARRGASAVLLIARCLDDESLRALADSCQACCLTALIECHDEGEIERALAIEGAVIGVNNRDLDSLQIDRARAPELLRLVPSDRIAVAESGYDHPEQVRELLGLADAVLVGTALMRAPDPAGFIRGVSTCGRS